MQLARWQGSSLFVVPESSANPRVLFLPDQDPAAGTATFDLTPALACSGYWIVAGPGADPTKAKIFDLRTAQQNAGRKGGILFFAKDGPSQSVPFANGQGTTSNEHNLNFAFGNYILTLRAGAVAFDPNTFQFLITSNGLAHQLTHEDNAYSANLSKEARLILQPKDGAVWRLGGQGSAENPAFTPATLTGLAVGVAFSRAGRLTAAGKRDVIGVASPIIADGNANIVADIDILAPFDGARSFLEIQGGSNAWLKTSYLSNFGHALWIEPRAGTPARFLFGWRHAKLTQDGLGDPANTQRWAGLTLVGDFSAKFVETIAAPAELGLMLGASPTEYLSMPPGQNWRLRLLRGPAHFEGLGEAGGADRLRGQGAGETTSWIRLDAASGAPATPQMVSEAADYQLLRQQEKNFAADPVLRSVRIIEGMSEAGFLPALPQGAINTLSIAAAKANTDFDAGVLARLRLKALLPPPAQTAARKTPFGARIDGARETRRLELGATSTRAEKQTLPFRFTATGPAEPTIFTTLQRDDLFIVANKIPTDARLEASLDIAGWRLYAAIPGVKLPEGAIVSPDSFVLIKGDRNRSLRALLADTRLWSEPLAFLSNTDAAKSAIDNWLKETNAKKAEPAYKNIDQILDAPEWTGVLIINPSFDFGALPLQIQGVLGGVQNKDKLRAHHAGFRFRRMADERPLSQAFGLIDYDDQKNADPKASAKDGYGYALERLTVEFANGRITNFVCDLLVLVEHLFGAGGTITGAQKPHVMKLRGSYEVRVADGKEHDVYTFSAENIYSFKFDDGIIERIDIDRLKFVTDRCENIGGGAFRVDTRFSIDGGVTFRLKDLLDTARIEFTDLDIELAFKMPPSFKIDFVKALFAPRRWRVRFPQVKGGQFLHHFPFRLKAFNWLEAGGASFSSLKLAPLKWPGALDGAFDFDLEFELDTGSLGRLAQHAAGLRLDLHLLFAKGLKKFGLGFRFNGAGEGFDIGVQDLFRVHADELATHQAGGTFALMARGAKLEVLGRDMPSRGLELALFVNEGAAKASQVGWFVSYAKDEKNDPLLTPLDIRALALGQRVDAFANMGGSARQLIDDVAKLGNVEGPNIIARVKAGTLGADPSRDWTIALWAVAFGRVTLDLVMRDPDLYGVRAALSQLEGAHPERRGDPPLWSIDVVYRRLAGDLGVYSGEFIPPASWRQIEMGAVSLTLPAIGVELDTKGGWAIDLGYPKNKNFERAFAVQVLPFIGAGGFYLRQMSGGGGQMIPQPKCSIASGPKEYKSDLLDYDPVTEIGAGLRVGLGKEIVKGPLRAGLSLTIYAYLEGAYARLKDKLPANGQSGARSTYIAVRGVAGIMGELYGYVDFGIVRAGVALRVYSGVGFQLETDRRTRLYLEAGVSVHVTVVIARVRVFGRSFEISVSFSFHATVEYSTYIGSDGDRSWYVETSHPSSLAFDDAPPVSPLAANGAPFQWTTAFVPDDWRKVSPQKPNLELLFAPDVSFQKSGEGAAAKMSPAVVAMLFAPSQKAGSVSGIEMLSAAFGVWALRSAWPRRPGKPHTWEISHDSVSAVLRDLAGKPGADSAARRARAPTYADLVQFLSANFNISVKIGAPGNEGAGDPTPHAAFPLPPDFEFQIRSGPGQYRDIALGQFSADQDRYIAQIDDALDRFAAALEARAGGPVALVGAAQPNPTPIAKVIFEDHLNLWLRSALERFQIIIADNTQSPADTMLLSNVLDKMWTPPANGLSPAGEVAGFVTRLMLHGLRVPAPEDAKRTKGLYEVTGLQQILKAGDDAIRLKSLPAYLRGSAPIDQTDMVIDANRLQQYSAAIDKLSGGFSDTARLASRFDASERAFAAQPPHILDDALLLFAPGEVRSLLAKNVGATVQKRGVSSASVKSEANSTGEKDLLKQWCVALTFGLKQVRQGSDGTKPVPLKSVYEIVASSEADRVLLDELLGPSAPELTGVELYVPQDQGRWRRIKARANILQENLSQEANPEPPAMMAMATAPATEFVHSIDEQRPFLTLLQRAAVANSGAYFLTYPGAEELAPLFGETPEKEEAGARGVRVLLLVRLANAEDRRFANSASIDPLSGSKDASSAYVFQMSEKVSEPRHPPGVTEFEIERPPIALPKNPTPDDRVACALSERFSMLAYTLRLDDAAGASKTLVDADLSLPVSPTESADNGRMLYRLALPLHQLAKEANPYLMVGRKGSLTTSWRDIYGNTLSKSATALDFTVRYSDRLLPLNDLPWLCVHYRPEAGAFQFAAYFGLDDEELCRSDSDLGADQAKDPNPEWLIARADMIDRAIVAYERAILQLQDPRASMKAVWVRDGKPTKESLSLDRVAVADRLEEEVKRLDDARTTVRAHKGTRAALTGALRAKLRQDKLEALPFQIALPNEPFIEVRFELAVERSGVSAALTNEPPLPSEVARVAFDLKPFMGADPFRPAKSLANPRADLETFAKRLEAVAASYLAATGLGATPGVSDRAIWLVKTELAPAFDDKGHNAPFVYAPLPIALSPLSQSFDGSDGVWTYAPNNGAKQVSASTTDADVDAMCALALDRIEEVCGPAIAGVMLSEPSLAQPRVRAAFNQILKDKEKLAHQLAEYLAPVLETQAGSAGGEERAKRAFYDRLRRRLTAFYDTDVVLIYDAKSGERALNRESPHLHVRVDGGAIAPELTFSAFSPPVGAPANAAPGEKMAPDLILFGRAEREPTKALPFPNSVRATHVQRKPTPEVKVESEGPYRATAWLEFILPRAAKALPVGLTSVPIPRRRLPAPPAFEAHAALTTQKIAENLSFAKRAELLRAWVYELRFQHEAAAPLNDTTHMVATFAGPQPDAASSGPASWFARAIARFVLSTDSAMAPLRAGKDAEALDYFKARLRELVSRPMAMFAPVASSDTETISWVEKIAGPQRIVEWKFTPKKPGVTIEIMTPGANPAVAPANAGNGTFTFTPDPAETPASTKRKRGVRFKGLDVIDRRGARASLRVTRNETINGQKARRGFVYSRDGLSVNDRAEPLISYPYEFMLCDAGASGSLSSLLNAAIQKLVGANAEADIHAYYNCGLFKDDHFSAPHQPQGRYLDGGAVSVNALGALPDLIKTRLGRLQPPSVNGAARIVFDVRIYLKESENSQCVIRLERATLPLSAISDAAHLASLEAIPVAARPKRSTKKARPQEAEQKDEKNPDPEN